MGKQNLFTRGKASSFSVMSATARVKYAQDAVWHDFDLKNDPESDVSVRPDVKEWPYAVPRVEVGKTAMQ
jgi:hypothetical protein